MLGKPVLMLDHGEQVVANDPADLRAHLLLAEAAVSLRHWSLGLWFLEQAQRVRGHHVLIHRARAILCERKGDVKQAMACWELVEQCAPGNAEARFHLKDLSARDTLGRSNYRDRLETPS